MALSAFLGAENLLNDVTPTNLKNIAGYDEKREGLKHLVKNFIRTTHAEFKDTKKQVFPGLPKFYPHQEHLYSKEQDPVARQSTFITEEESEIIKKAWSAKVKNDKKMNYFSGLFSSLGIYKLLSWSIKEANGLTCFLLQKHLLKWIFSSGHKNYANSILAFITTVLKHNNPQFSHRYLWNIFAGRPGKGQKFGRDQKNEHLNR